MKKLFLGIMLCMAVGVAAKTIKGGVIDAQGNAMPFVTISVMTKDSTLITGAITDDDGRYEIQITNDQSQKSSYIIQASYIGYHTAYGGPDFVMREETASGDDYDEERFSDYIFDQNDYTLSDGRHVKVSTAYDYVFEGDNGNVYYSNSLSDQPGGSTQLYPNR